jgi:threonyl-tRNA synthetase
MAHPVETVRHSLSHVMAEAVVKLYPGTKVAIGPAIADGFYYDFQLPSPMQNEDLPAIEKEMRRIIAANAAFKRVEVSKAEALKMFADEPFKVELIEGLRTAPSAYTSRAPSATCAAAPTWIAPATLGPTPSSCAP